MIRAGRSGEADTLFLKKNYAGIGWKIGDLGSLRPTREAFKQKIQEAFPELKQGATRNFTGQLFRFVHEIKVGDTIVYPSKLDRQVHIGKFTGPCKYDPTVDENYPNLRPVKWIKNVPRTYFSQGALYEIGSAMTVFQVKNYADEFLTALKGEPGPIAGDADVTVPLVAEEIEQNTRTFVLNQLARKLKGHPLAALVAHLLETMGYRTRVSPEGPDGSIDVVAHRDEFGFVPPIVKIQVKSEEGTIGDPIVSQLYAKVLEGEYGMFVTLGTFSKQARDFAKSKPNLRLIDGDELVDLLLEHYGELAPQYKRILPLRQVYIPDSGPSEE